MSANPSINSADLVVSQQPSCRKRKRSEEITCSFPNSEEFSQQEHGDVPPNPSSSKEDLEIFEGTILGDHHVVEHVLGEGGFGIVTKCRNTQTNQVMAIKVNKSDPEILKQSKMEIFILEQLRALGEEGRCNFVHWNGFFFDGERICLNFELLDQSLQDFIEDRDNQGLPVKEFKPVLHQITNALFHLGSLGIVHSDLKPENIMVVNRHESPIKVKLIDFGLAFPACTLIPGYRVGTVGFTAPEVMLGGPCNEAIDMWALGLVAVELATGVPLYPGKSDYAVLKFIIETQGQPPDHILDSGVYTDDYFNEDNYNIQRFTLKTEEEIGYQSKDTRYIKLKCLDDLEQLLKVRRGPEDGQHLFVNLIKQMLALDANQRITPSEVLHHPFFNPGLSESSPCTDMSGTGGQNIMVSQQLNPVVSDDLPTEEPAWENLPESDVIPSEEPLLESSTMADDLHTEEPATKCLATSDDLRSEDLTPASLPVQDDPREEHPSLFMSESAVSIPNDLEKSDNIQVKKKKKKGKGFFQRLRALFSFCFRPKETD